MHDIVRQIIDSIMASSLGPFIQFALIIAVAFAFIAVLGDGDAVVDDDEAE